LRPAAGQAAHRRRRLALADGEIAFVERGGRSPLLLVHAFPLDHRMWAPQMDAFAPARRVVAPDLAGFGGSTVPGRASVEAHADDLAMLLDDLHIERAVVVGLSMGGYIALAMWRRHSRRLAGLVLADTRAGADTDEARANRRTLASDVGERGADAAREAMLPGLLSPGAAPALREHVAEIIGGQAPAGITAALGAMAARPDATGDLAAIEVPTLVLVGRRDTVTPPTEAEAIAQAIPGARLAIVPGAGHLANLEEPGAFNAALRGFLNALDDAAGA
jgi:pimeloyl-ACP methyl ester carboxylesterase